MSTVTAPSRCMTMEQARFLVELLHKAVPAEPDLKPRLAEEMRTKADSFTAHRVISYVLMHNMSDDNNALYVIDQLGLGD